MIIQCNHCSAKFRIDDAKLANGPVKVRCAKCKEVFVVEGEDAAAAQMPPAAVPPVAPAVATGSSANAFSDSSDFSFDQEQPATDNAPADDEFDWKDTSVSENTPAHFSAAEPATPTTFQPQESAAEADDFDFGDINLQSSPTAAHHPPQASAQEDFSIDFGEVSFAEPTAPESATKGSFAAASTEDFSFDASPEEVATPAAGSDDFLLSFSADKADGSSATASPAEAGDNVNFGDFSFGEVEEESKTEQTVAPKMPLSPAKAIPDASFQDVPDEELVPTSLATRKKSGSRFPLFLIVGAIFLVVVLAGAGIYFVGGPKAFSKVGLGFLVDWYGDKSADEGSIAIRNVLSSYVVHSTAGELFVVKGEAVNNFKKPRASIQVKVSILGSGGLVLASKSAFCGNSLTAEQLASLPLAKIEETMNNQFGDSLANMGVKPGSSIPFVVVMSAVPKEATDYSVQVAGSTVATQ
jgi:predicted Zn finger-like uncharacterized protein